MLNPFVRSVRVESVCELRRVGAVGEPRPRWCMELRLIVVSSSTLSVGRSGCFQYGTITVALLGASRRLPFGELASTFLWGMYAPRRGIAESWGR